MRETFRKYSSQQKKKIQFEWFPNTRGSLSAKTIQLNDHLRSLILFLHWIILGEFLLAFFCILRSLVLLDIRWFSMISDWLLFLISRARSHFPILSKFRGTHPGIFIYFSRFYRSNTEPLSRNYNWGDCMIYTRYSSHSRSPSGIFVSFYARSRQISMAKRWCQKGLRSRNSPMCTLSQNGYGGRLAILSTTL